VESNFHGPVEHSLSRVQELPAMVDQ
jgi:hypothetical protein